LEALGRLQKDVPLEITIIGGATPDERSRKEKELILKVIEKYQMGHIVRMLGYQPYKMLFEETYKHHIFLSPSVTAKDGDAEGGAPVTIIEMAASGMPVVSTTHCDILGLFPEDERKFLAEERDVEGLLSLLRRLIEIKGEWKSTLMACREHIEKEFNCRTQGINLGNIYKGL